MPEKKNDALVVIANEVPAYVRDQDAGRGFAPDDQDMVKLPFFRVLQGQSKEVSNSPALLGKFWSDHHGKTIDAPFDLIAIKYEKEFMHFDEERNLIWRTTDGNDERLLQTARDLDLPLRFFAWRHFLCLAPYQHPDIPAGLGVLSFKGMTTNIAKQWYTAMKNRPGDMCAQVHTVTIDTGKNEKGSWYFPQPTFRGYLPLEDYDQILKVFEEWAATPLGPQFEDAPTAEAVREAEVLDNQDGNQDGEPLPF